MATPQRVDGIEEDQVSRSNQKEEHTGRTRVHSWRVKRETVDTMLHVNPEDLFHCFVKVLFYYIFFSLLFDVHLENSGSFHSHHSQEPKKDVQGVGHFLGTGLGSPIGKAFMCR